AIDGRQLRLDRDERADEEVRDDLALVAHGRGAVLDLARADEARGVRVLAELGRRPVDERRLLGARASAQNRALGRVVHGAADPAEVLERREELAQARSRDDVLEARPLEPERARERLRTR